ncbi:MAG TPA: hypothetical protein VF762_10990 [Blastocatellia bacterium]|jgi:hypothetical protein
MSGDARLDNPYIDEDYKRRLETRARREREQFQSHERKAGLFFQSEHEWLSYSAEIVAINNTDYSRGF